MYCKNCGNQIPEGAKFCPVCGAESAAPARPAPAPAAPPAGKAKKPVSLVLVGLLLLGAVLLGALVLAPNAGNPCEKAERMFNRLGSFEDIIDKGPDMAELLLGMAQEDVDMGVFGRLPENDTPDSTYYDLYGYLSVQEHDVGLSMICRNSRVERVTISILGGGGLTGPQMDAMADYAVSVYGASYEYRETLGHVHYTWPGVDLGFMVFSDGTGVADLDFT